MHICRDCKHSRRGEAIDLRLPKKGFLAPGPRPTPRDGSYICSIRAGGLSRTLVNPVDGSGGYLRGPDCHDLNADGECTEFSRKAWSARFFG